MFYRPALALAPFVLLLLEACSTPATQTAPASPTAEAHTEVTKVTCVGEQTTHSAHRENDPEYPTRLAELLGNQYEVSNRGLPKGRVLSKANAPESDAYILGEPFAMRLTDQPNVVVLGPWGRHDTYEGNWPEHKSEFSADLEALVQAYVDLDSHPVVLLATPLPYNGGTDHAITELLKPTQALADEMSLATIDLWSAFLGHPEWYKDGTHLTPEGQQQQAKIVAAAIRDLR